MKKIWNIIGLFLALLLSVGVMTFFRACAPAEDGSWMHCHAVQLYIFGAGLICAAVMAGALFVKSKSMAVLLHLICLAGGVIVIVLPRVQKMCLMNTMRCRAVMTPASMVISILMMMVCLISLTARLKDKAEGHK